MAQTNNTTNDTNNALLLGVLADSYVLAGELDKAQETITRALNLMPESRDSLQGPSYSVSAARIMAIAGQRDEALLEIERLLNTPGGLIRWNLYLSPEWDFFRDDERFNELIRPLNLKEAKS